MMASYGWARLTEKQQNVGKAANFKIKVTKLRLIRYIFKSGGEGGGMVSYNRGEILLIFFHVSDHLEQFGGVSFFASKNSLFGRMGGTPPPPRPWKIP